MIPPSPSSDPPFSNKPSSRSIPPQPPFLTIEGVPNFRDLGNYPCHPPPSTSALTSNPSFSTSKSYITRPFTLFRSAQLTTLTPAGISALTSLKIRRLYDLRSEGEVSKRYRTSIISTKSGVGEINGGIKCISVPVFREEYYSPEDLAQRYKNYTDLDEDESHGYSAGFVRAYRDILLNAGPAFRQIFEHVRDRVNPADGGGGGGGGDENESIPEPLVFHCATGKDRTGVFAALVLRLCGVPDEIIAWEYALTEQGLGNWREVIISHFMAEKKYRPGLPAMTRAQAERAIGSRPADVRVFLRDVLDGEMGGVKRYMQEKCGLSAEDVELIRRKLVVEGESVFGDGTGYWKGGEHKDRDEQGPLGLAKDDGAGRAARSGLTHRAIETLIDNGADVNAVDNDRRTPLHDAARSDLAHWAMGRFIDKGADVNAVDKDGRTPLHDAAPSGLAHRAIETLIDTGADVNAVNEDGHTPLYEAGRLNSEEKILHAPTPGFNKSEGELSWSGLETYKKCEGIIGDNLTIIKVGSQDHCFAARSISEILQESYPFFGFEILDWITKLCERSQVLGESTTSQISSSKKSYHSFVELRKSSERYVSTAIAGWDETERMDLDSARLITAYAAASATIRGELHGRKLSWMISSNSKHFALNVKDALMWTISALRSYPEDANGLFTWTPVSSDVELPEISRFEPARTESYCWTELFSYVCIANSPSEYNRHRPALEGLEIDFDLLIKLAAVDREIAAEDGLFLFGFDTALIPLEPPESRRWHFLLTNGRQITPQRVKKNFDSLRFRGVLGPEYRSGYVYVGWCSSPVVTIGTMDSDTIPVEEVSMTSGIRTVEELEECVERASNNDMSLNPRIGFLGSSIGVSAGKKREKKYNLVNVNPKRTRGGNFESILTSARATPCILWDQIAVRAWLVPAISVLLFASLRYIKWKRFSFKAKQGDGQFEAARIHYGCRSSDTTRSAEDALRQNQMLLVDKANEVTVNDEETFGDIVKQTWYEMADADDVCFSNTTGKRWKISEHIAGYDLAEAICRTRKQLRSLPIEGSIHSWQGIVDAKYSQVIFCRNAGAVLSCNPSTTSHPCYLIDFPKGALRCLFQDLRIFYGERWDTLSESCNRLSKMRRFPIGDDHGWIPHGYESCRACPNKYSMKMLQLITPNEVDKGKLKKKTPQSNGQVESRDTPLIFPSQNVPTIVTFGCI